MLPKECQFVFLPRLTFTRNSRGPPGDVWRVQLYQKMTFRLMAILGRNQLLKCFASYFLIHLSLPEKQTI